MFRLKGMLNLFLMLVLVGCQGWMNEVYAGQGQGHGQGQGQGHGQGQGQGQGHGYGKMKAIHSSKKGGKSNQVKFGAKDKAIMTKYFSATPFPVTTLPPGIAKNLLRGKPLPPGIAKVFLPSGLLSQLPVYPGYDYLVVGRDVVLVNSVTGIIADVISNIVQ